MKLARVTVTIPAALLKQLDRLAGKYGRSRSWCVAEAVRRYVAHESAAPSSVRESPPLYDLHGLGEQRLRQLTEDMALTPAERVRAADAVSRIGRRPAVGARLIQFDRYEDYLEWQKGEGLLT